MPLISTTTVWFLFIASPVYPANPAIMPETSSTELLRPANPPESRAAAAIQAFFDAFGAGDLDALVATFTGDAIITAVRTAERDENAAGVYGTYRGHAGVRAFVANLGANFDTKAFDVERIVGEGDDVAFATGSFTHVVKATGREFSSDWALMCVVTDGRISEYRFFEDSAAFATASSPND